MKIVHLCLSSFYIDDYSYQENMLPKYHVLQGHEVSVIASLVSFDQYGTPCLLKEESVKQTKDGFKVIRIDYKKPFYKFNKYVRIYNNTYKVLEAEAPDLIFIHDFSFVDISKVIKYVSKKKNIKVYVDCHTDYINSAKSWVSKKIYHHFIWRYYAKKLSPFVEKFYGVTPLRCDFLRQAYKINNNKIELLVMGVDDLILEGKNEIDIKNKISNSLNIKSESFVIVAGGKIDKNKNFHLLIEAFLKVNIPNLVLVIFGTINLDFKDEFNVLMSKSNNIKFVGWLNASNILDYLIFADLVVFPGTHSVLWEQAVAIGKPCFFKFWDGMNHVDIGGNCEFLFTNSDDEIKTKICQLLDDNNSKFKLMKSCANSDKKFSFYYSEIAQKSLN